MDQKIILDDKSFKALSADSRVSILKSLGERRRTLSELSQKLSLGGSTIKEHCDILIDAELIKQIDEGRKWKYYELTQKGKQIITPNLLDEVKVLIILCTGVVLLGGVLFFASALFGSVNSAGPTSAQMNIESPILMNTISTTGSINSSNKDMVKSGTGTNPKNVTGGKLITSGVSTDTNENPQTVNNTQTPQTVTDTPLGQCETNTVTQCSINTNPGITTEMFIISTMISIIFGIVLGWATLRRRA
ncbi:MAG: winged helix-turn-helix domain-containing protein [Candidatus Diapherotrites archaeon]|nr:winged helix-turn-helix domain-containing protein [Candidatus Diapherotrites archaeon]